MTSDVQDVSELVDLNILARWMETVGLGQGELTHIRPLTGGTQNIMFSFTQGQRHYIFRGPPPHPRPESNTVMAREGRILEGLAETDVPHPGFIKGCWDQSVLGRNFYLMEPVDGFNAINGLPKSHQKDPQTRQRMGYSYIEALAKLGAVDYQKIGLSDFGQPDGFLERQGARWVGQLHKYGKYESWAGHKDLGDFEAIAKWLDDNIPPGYLPGILHGDCHIGNVMFHSDGPEVAALIDWEMCTIGDPLLDLGWVVATWPTEINLFGIKDWDGFPSLIELIQHYAQHSSRNVETINWYSVLACFKLGSILEGSYARSTAGKAPIRIGEQFHGAAITLFNRARRYMTQDI